jgi:hypothetical protein
MGLLITIKPLFPFELCVLEHMLNLGSVTTGSHPLDKSVAMKPPFSAYLGSGKFIFTNQPVNSIFTYTQQRSGTFYV